MLAVEHAGGRQAAGNRIFCLFSGFLRLSWRAVCCSLELTVPLHTHCRRASAAAEVVGAASAAQSSPGKKRRQKKGTQRGYYFQAVLLYCDGVLIDCRG